MEENNEKYVVDFEGVQNYMDIHKALKEGLEFPEYYGANLYALWDCLTDMMEDDLEITLKNYQDMEKLHKEYSESILEVFCDARHWAEDMYTGVRIIVERDGAGTEIGC